MGCWGSQNLMADTSKASDPIQDRIAGDCWARRQLRSGVRFISVASILKRSLTLVRVVFTLESPWRSQNSMADSSTTTGPILNLIAGGYWA